ncbi:MAG: hypothetical protein RhofKO_10200 [Rhodothermales bacterium]
MPRHIDEVRYVVLHQQKARVPNEMGHVVGAAGDEVVHAHYRVPFGDEPITEVRADEACTSGDESAWASTFV